MFSGVELKFKEQSSRKQAHSSGLLSYTNGSHEGFVEFCVIEVFKF